MNIVYCTDFSKNSAHAFRQATFYAEATTSKLYILHVIPGPYTAEETETAQHPVLGHPDMEKVLDHIETEYLANGDAKYEAVVRHGNETAEIVKFADSVDAGLIVIGSRGVGSLAGFFGGGGGVAEKVIKNSSVPVLVVPPE
jgi:nucleotide-binding universal stress UspA family protein